MIRFNHIVLLGAEKTMLGGKQAAQPAGKTLQQQVTAMTKPVISGRLIAEQTQALSVQGLRRLGYALLKTDPDLF